MRDHKGCISAIYTKSEKQRRKRRAMYICETTQLFSEYLCNPRRKPNTNRHEGYATTERSARVASRTREQNKEAPAQKQVTCLFTSDYSKITKSHHPLKNIQRSLKCAQAAQTWMCYNGIGGVFY